MDKRQITLSEKIDLVFGFTQAIIGTFFVALAAPFRGTNTPKTFSRHVVLSMARRVLGRMSTAQMQYIAGTSESNYLAWCKAKHLTPRIVNLADVNTKAFWLGEPDAENVIIHFHGGGFAMPASDGHFTFLTSLLTKAKAAGKSVGVLVLGYDLAPSAQYPRQLTQAVELLRYVTTALGKSPSRIILSSDSAGGNLAFGLLSHLLHPHPKIQPLTLAQPLRGAMLSSPVSTLHADNPRFRTHEKQDPAPAKTIRTWFGDELGSAKSDAWNEPLNVDASWWNDLSKVIDEMLVTIASNEMFAVDTRACVQKIQTVYKHLKLISSETDFHSEPTIGPSMGMAEGEAAKVIISWACERM